MKLAPIILFAYNRPEHTQAVLDSLMLNEESLQSELFIYIDGLKEKSSEEVVEKRNKVIAIANSKKWCAKVTVKISDYNKGLSRSVIDGVSEIIREYKKVIVLEDDLVTDKYFLSYMNKSLDLYEKDEEVACISAYTYPVKDKLPSTFFIKGADCWGWATWERAWNIFNENGSYLLDELTKRKLESEFNFNDTYPYIEMLKDQIAGKNSSWAVRWYASAFLFNKLCLYPGTSLIKNIGNDGTGTHSGDTKLFDTNLKNSPVTFNRIDLKVNQHAYNAFSVYFKTLKPASSGIKNLLKQAYKKLTPYVFRKAIYRWRHSDNSQKPLWTGNYKSWDDVTKQCTGYDGDEIFEKVKNATLAVKQNKAVFERDSVLFYEPEFNSDFVELIDTLARENTNQIRLIDFGGSLGSVYYQYKQKLSQYKVQWNVIEQGHFVKFGKEQLTNSELRFYYTIDECLNENQVDAILLSSVLSYIEKPYDLLKSILKYKFKYVIIDRTLFIPGNSDLLTKQQVPEEIYKASYPCWIFSKEKLIKFMSENYLLINDFDPYNNELIDVDGKKAAFRGLIFSKKQ